VLSGSANLAREAGVAVPRRLRKTRSVAEVVGDDKQGGVTDGCPPRTPVAPAGMAGAWFGS
jgi:hypothetical protein